jgi:hypothetical protein
MDISEQLKDPLYAALFAAAVTAAYIHVKAHMNNEGKLKLSDYAKPASLVAILVFFIVQSGTAAPESILTDPF